MDFSAVAPKTPPTGQTTGQSITFDGNSFGPPEIHPHEIQYVRKIGHGCFGNVYVGMCRGKEVAVKKLYRQDMEDKALRAFKHEVEICSRIHHPNITLFMGACLQPGEMAIVTELLPLGNLEQVLHDPARKIPLVRRMRMARDAAQGINWLHLSNPMIMHRDIKPSNLLVDSSGRIKVCDFGLSMLKEKGEKLRDKGKTPGTPLWMAPEVLMGRPVDEKCDVYSFAIVLWEIEMTAHTFKRSICVDSIRPPLPQDMLPSLKLLLQRCWQKNAARRPAFSDIIKALDEIIIEAAVGDVDGVLMWKNAFPGQDQVQWDKFRTALTHAVGMPMLEENCIEFECVKAVCAEASSDTMLKEREQVVTLDHFGQVVSCFRPLCGTEGDARSKNFVEKIKEAVLSPWFHGDIDRVQAESALQRKPIGTFLIRMSFTVPGSPFTVSKINRQGLLNHQRIDINAHGVLTLKRGENVHQSRNLVTLIERAKDDLMLMHPCPNSKYASLLAATSGELTPSIGYQDLDELADIGGGEI